MRPVKIEDSNVQAQLSYIIKLRVLFSQHHYDMNQPCDLYATLYSHSLLVLVQYLLFPSSLCAVAVGPPFNLSPPVTFFSPSVISCKAPLVMGSPECC